MSEITVKRQAILNYIRQYQTEVGYPPTIIEIGKALGLAKTTVHYHLGKLIQEGRIVRRANSARGMQVTQYSFVITGKIKPYVRMTRRGKWANPDAQEYLASQEAIGYQIKQQMSAKGWQMLPAKTSLAIELSIATDKVNISDLDNIIKAICDSANGIVYPDDRWIDRVKAWRYKADTPKAELTVWIRLEKGNPQ